MTLNLEKHPDADQIRGYLLGKLPASAIDDVAGHVEHCPECESTIVALGAVSDTVVAQIAAAKPAAESAPPESDVLRQALQRVMEFGNTAQSGDRMPSPEVVAAGAGERIGVYQLLDKLGEGGMGAVYKARHTKLDKIVAIKLLLRDKTRSPQTVSRFEREMRAVGKLDHSHIVRALDAGEVDGTHYLVMEYVQGADLGALVKQHGPLPVAVACELIRQAAIGLQYAYERDMVHRDIKPSNLMLTHSGEVKVLDLGLALLADSPDGVELTSSGQVMGTIDYMAPEQLHSSHQVDTRADVFGLGATLYKLLTGEAPFVGAAHDSLMSKMLAVASGKYTPLKEKRGDAPPELSRLVDQMLAKDAAQRLPTPAAVADGLAPFAAGADLSAYTGGAETKAAPQKSIAPRAAGATAVSRAVSITVPPQTASNSPPRHRRPAVLLGGLGAAAAVLLGIFLIIRDKNGNETGRIELKDGDKVEVVDQHVSATPAQKAPEPLKVANNPASPPMSHSPDSPELNASLARVVATAPTDDPKPFWIVRAAEEKDAKPAKYTTLARAIQALGDNDVLEIHGNGPFIVSPTRVEQPKLHIRGAPGYRPQFDAVVPGAAMLTVPKAELRIEGCDFRMPQGNFRPFISGDGAEWTLANCRFLAGGSFHNSIDYAGPRLKLADSMVVIGAAWDYPDQWLTLRGADVELQIANCIIRVGGKTFIPAMPNGKLRAVLTNNTFSGSCMLLPSLKDVKTDIDVTATHNVFQLNEANGNAIFEAAYENWKGKVQWHGSDNLYAGGKYGLARFRDKERKDVTLGLAGFATFPGRDEKQATEADAIYPMWRAAYAAQEPNELAAAYQRLMTLPHAIKGFDQPGPDWSLVGPGDAYLRALSASNGAVAPADLRPKPFEGGVFVLKHGDQIKRGFDQLKLAFDAADDNDVIEIRTDDDSPGFGFENQKRLKALTVKAAPGYTPIVTGIARWLRPGLELHVEGLHFRGGNLNYAYDVRDVKRDGVLAEVVNCAFTQPEHSWGAGWSIGDTSNFPPIEQNKVCTLRNCAISGAVYLEMRQSSRLEIHNSVIGALCLIGSGAGADSPNVLMDHSAVWTPAIFSDPYISIALRPVDPKAPTHFRFDVHGCWLENSIGLLRCNANCALDWSGGANVYGVGKEIWFAGAEPDVEPVDSLGVWRRHWNSDQNSLEVEAAVYDPRMWKLMPATPGAGQGPDGKDLGADVSRIAVTPGAP